MKIAELLRGCEPGRMQQVGYMAILPLVSELQDDRFAPPDDAKIGTEGYGKLIFTNEGQKPVLVPVGATYIVQQAAQNHALPTAAFIKEREVKRYENAMCVQQTQGGLIASGKHTLMLLPYSLREQAHKVRKEREYGRLWPAIAAFNRAAGVQAGEGRGHLEFFFDTFRKQLDQFVAEFEPVRDQVGFICLINGKVVGVERTPSTPYFLSIWRPLIRECYGSLALVEANKGTAKPPATRMPLRRAKSLDDLAAALNEVETEEKNRIKRLVTQIVDMDVIATNDESLAEIQVEGLDSPDFCGQAIKDGPKVVYTSIIAKKALATDWMLAKEFSMT